MTQQINMCTQQMLICRNNQVCLHGIFAYENINVMMFKFIFGHYANKRFVERIMALLPSPQAEWLSASNCDQELGLLVLMKQWNNVRNIRLPTGHHHRPNSCPHPLKPLT